jgi:hypothetical protein
MVSAFLRLRQNHWKIIGKTKKFSFCVPYSMALCSLMLCDASARGYAWGGGKIQFPCVTQPLSTSKRLGRRCSEMYLGSQNHKTNPHPTQTWEGFFSKWSNTPKLLQNHPANSTRNLYPSGLKTPGSSWGLGVR